MYIVEGYIYGSEIKLMVNISVKLDWERFCTSKKQHEHMLEQEKIWMVCMGYSIHRNQTSYIRSKAATVCLWLFVAMLGLYILWEINPEPLKNAAGYISEQSKETFIDYASHIFIEVSPAVSYVLSQDDAYTVEYFQDPFYKKYLRMSEPGDG